MAKSTVVPQASSRKIVNPEQYSKEKACFELPFLIPRNAPELCDTQEMKLYQDLIWEYPPDTYVEKYGMTVTEMAILFGQENNGKLLASHMKWLLHKANEKSPDCLCLCLPTMSTNRVEENLKHKSRISRLIFVLNVGKNLDGSVFIASAQQSGSHWVLVVVDFKSETLFYCDSQGWNIPTLLCQKLSSYSEQLNLPIPSNIIVMHVSSSLVSNRHHCSKLCRNFPFQTSDHGSGIVSVIFAIIAALDYEFLNIFIRGNSCCNKSFLHDPSKYERHMQRIVIHWFMKEELDVSVFKDVVHIKTFVELDHSYCGEAILFTRKETSRSSETNQDKKVKESETLSNAPNHSSHRKKQIHECQSCNLIFSTRQAKYIHKRRQHNSFVVENLTPRSSCCELCKHFRTSRIQDLISHYCQVHGQKIDICTQKFCNELEFNTWKKEIENESSCQFTQGFGTKTSAKGGVKIRYLYCHRSGYRKSVTERKRCQKSQGSCKIDKRCTAYMTARTNLDDGSVSVEYCLHHIGHSFKPVHLHISKEMRSFIAGRLSQGVESNKILKDLQDRMIDIDHRDSLITRKDICNIKRQYNITDTEKHCEGVEKHENESRSVDLWVQELEKQADNPIIYYKDQQTSHEILLKQDFLLCIQTDFQRSTLFAQAPRVVYVESAHDAMHNDFILTTIFVLDDNDEGTPVAWAISNQVNLEMLQIFMDAVKKSCGKEIQPNIFLSDIEDVLYNAWCSVFPRPMRRRYSAWHVDKQWRDKSDSLVESETDQCVVYTFLKHLQTEVNETNFRELLQETLAYLQKQVPSFWDYFYKKFVCADKIYLWGQCFHQDSFIDTKLFAGAVARVLKDVYLEVKPNRRMDNLLNVLLNYAREKAVDEMLRSHKEKSGQSLREIQERHAAAVNVNNIVKCPEGDRWIVSSITKNDQKYTVERMLGRKCGCKLVCNLCHICIHMYTCTCHDFLFKPVSCKHIHAVQMSLNSINDLKLLSCIEEDNEEDTIVIVKMENQ